MPRIASSYRVCGVRIDPMTAEGAAGRLLEAAAQGQGLAVHLCNVDVLARAVHDQRYAALLEAGELNVPDGAPVAWIGRRLGLRAVERVAGSDLFHGVVDRGRSAGLRHYLYGSSSDVVERLGDNLRRELPGAAIVAADSPPFRPLTDVEEDELVERIRASAANVVWIGLGTPKQDCLVARLRGRVDAVLVPVGAAFDFLAGTKRRAPRWMQRAGLEWLHRLASEPRRLWRRYLVGNVRFLVAVLRDRPTLVERDGAQP